MSNRFDHNEWVLKGSEMDIMRRGAEEEIQVGEKPAYFRR